MTLIFFRLYLYQLLTQTHSLYYKNCKNMKIKLIQKQNPLDRSQPAKWYANAVNAGTKDLKAIATDIAGRSSLTRGDIENVLSNFLDRLPGYLMDGFSVKMGDLGTMRLTLSCDGSDTPETFNTASIKPKLKFVAGVDMKAEIAKTTYQQS